ncbi:hypothetical protein H5V45_11395 [Nocardioides sp. KIGAM211]|uniref:Uncharacterized protein n=1 Tax=Nocardioides luti TaxID=2761101 RepID=A0A7X0RGN3_9ACTN|nr:hypothetical protein [Nocardioides luti]MBB6627922.1 hypothetical protein [Nocardioides luti]
MHPRSRPVPLLRAGVLLALVALFTGLAPTQAGASAQSSTGAVSVAPLAGPATTTDVNPLAGHRMGVYQGSGDQAGRRT